MIHSSALLQEDIQPPELKEIVERNPAIVAKLLPLEEQIRVMWPIKDYAPIDPETLGKPARNVTKEGFGTLDNDLGKAIQAPRPTSEGEERPSRMRRISNKVMSMLKTPSSSSPDDVKKDINGKSVTNGASATVP
jgi:hypothetical protein